MSVGVVALLIVLAGAVGPARPAEPWRTISGPSPFGGCSGGGLDGLFANAEVEPSVAVDPRNPRRLIAVFQQDRFSTGAARGLVASRSEDGGRSWSEVELPFSVCAGGRRPDGRARAIRGCRSARTGARM